MVREIPLTQGKVSLVDDEDFERVSLFNWHAEFIRGKWYARRKVYGPGGSRKNESLHQFLVPVCLKQTVDHVNGDGLDNRRSVNLRPATKLQQMHNRNRPSHNTSGFIGVTWSKVSSKWAAQINVQGEHRHIGLFDSAIDAAKAYDRIALSTRGEFAVLNFPSEERAA